MKLPNEIWLEIEDIRRRDFKRRIDDFEKLFKERAKNRILYSRSTIYLYLPNTGYSPIRGITAEYI
jgi:hypothetical protein